MSNFEQEKDMFILKKKKKKTTKSDKQMTIEGGDTSLSIAGRSDGSSSPMFNNSGDDAQVPEDH
jgi:hypothetical protein